MYIELLSKYKDVFAWSYKEMPGLDPKVSVHNLVLNVAFEQSNKPNDAFDQN